MAIEETEVEIVVTSTNVKHYESLGYEIPRRIKKRRKLTVTKGTKIRVVVEDLMRGSSARVTKICDICGEKANKPIQYGLLLKGREMSGGLDTCQKCGINKKRENYVKKADCLIVTHLYISEMLINKEDAYNHTHASHKKLWFKCNTCDNVFRKRVADMTRYSNACPRCSDGISYPEKFVGSLLRQLDVKFESQKIFEGWFIEEGIKYYDFYLCGSNSIIEVHGRQHYEESFERYGKRARTLEEEKANDELKKSAALENEIDECRYIVIDTRESKMEYIRNSILGSNLRNMFDLSSIDWNKCHEEALKSLVRTVCDVWNNGVRSAKKIGEVLNLNKCTARKYLKQGAKIGWCDYDADNERNVREVVQLSLKGEYISEFDSIEKAHQKTGVHKGNISLACTGKYSYAGGYRWMYKETYDNLTEDEIVNLRSNKIELLHQKREVYQLDENLNIINLFESISDARRQTGVNKVGEVCNGRRKTAGGYKWMFKND